MATNSQQCFMCPTIEQTEAQKDTVIEDAKNRKRVVGLDDKPFAICKSHGEDTPIIMTLKQTEKNFKTSNPRFKSERISVPIKNIPVTKFPPNITTKHAKQYLKEKFQRLEEEKEPELEEIKNDIQNSLDHENTRERELPAIISGKVVDKLVRKGVKDEAKERKNIIEEVKRIVKSVVEKHESREIMSEDIFQKMKEILSRGVQYDFTSSSDYQKIILRKGEEAELHVKQKIEDAIGSSPALIIMGFKVWAYTHEALQNIGVKLKTASNKSEVEHDIMVMTSAEGCLEVKFLQMKDCDIRPWEDKTDSQESMEDKRENFKKLATQALEQTVKDVRVFMEMFPDLSKETLLKIKFECFAALPFTEGLDLCEKCNKKILTKGVFGDLTKLRSDLNLFLPDILDVSVQDIFVKIASRYVGLGSIIPMKTLGDCHKEDMKQMEDVKKAYDEAFGSSSADQNGVELALQLSDDQIRITHHHGSMIVIGPHGSGKSIMLLLAVSRRIKELRDRQYQVKITVHLIIWEHSNKLKEMFTEFSKTFEDDVDTNINIYFKKEVLQQFETDDGGNRIKTLNDLMEKLKNDDEEVIVAIDEMAQLPIDPSKIGLVNKFIKSLFVNNPNFCDWSGLDVDPGSMTLLLSLQPVMSDNMYDYLVFPLPNMTSIIGPSTMEVYKLSSVYRNTRAIHNLLKQLNKERTPSVKEAWTRFCRGGWYWSNNQLNPSCVMDPAEETQGHGVEGAKPQWIVVPRCFHMVCTDSVGCFLNKNWDRIDSLLEKIHQQFGKKNVAVIVDIGKDNDREGVEWIKQKTGKEKVYDVEDFIGGETQALVFLQRGEYPGKPAKYNGWSRGTSHLSIITDNTLNTTFWSLDAAAREGVLQPIEIPTTFFTSLMLPCTSLCRLFGQNNRNDFIATISLLLTGLLLYIVPLTVASLLHWTGRTQCLTRLTDNIGGVHRFGIELVLTFLQLLSFLYFLFSYFLFSPFFTSALVVLSPCIIYSGVTTLAMASNRTWRMWIVVIFVLNLIVIILLTILMVVGFIIVVLVFVIFVF